MIPFYALKSSENLAKSRHTTYFCLASAANEDINKMQTIPSAHPAQNTQSAKQSTGIVFIILFAAALFLAHAVQSHLIATAFIACCSLFFDHFSAQTNSQMTDLSILVLFALALYGLFCFIRFNVTLAIIALIIAIIAAIFLSPDPVTRHEVKNKSAFPTLPKLENARGWSS